MLNENPDTLLHSIFKPPPPVGAGGGYMFSGLPSVPPSVRASVRASVIHVVVLCFHDISSICWQIFAKLLSLVHLGTQMTWLRFWVERVKGQGHTIAMEAHSTRRYRRVQLFLVIPVFKHQFIHRAVENLLTDTYVYSPSSSSGACTRIVRSAVSHSPPQCTVNSKLWNVCTD